MSLLQLDLNELALEERPGLTCNEGGRLAEAAAVTAERCGKTLPQTFKFLGVHQGAHAVIGPSTTDVMSRSLGDQQEATEWGACAIAIVAVEKLENLTVYERSPKSGFGFDYFLTPVDTPDNNNENFFESATHTLEVSGTVQDDESVLEKRSKEKLDRLKLRTQPLPVFVLVVDFWRTRANVVKHG